MAQLNQGIVAGDSAGQNVNALSDERRSAVDQLAGLLGISTSTAPDGALTINSGGVQLVSGNVAQTLMSTGSAATANLGVATSSGVALQPGGSIGADLTAVNTTLPGYQSQLSAVANALAGNLNTLQANGMAANGDPGAAIAGGFTGTVLPNIFVDQGSASTYTPSTMSAATIAVSSAYLADPSLIATAAAPGPGNSNVIGTATLDSTNAQAMAALAGSTTGPDSLYQSLIGTLGTEAANASGTSTAASNLATTAVQQPGLDLRREPEPAGGRHSRARRTPFRRPRRRSTPSTSPSSRSCRRCDVGVADITLSQAITQQLNQQELSIANLEEQVSSGRSLNKPSDNPAAVTQVLQLSSQASQLSNWQANAQTATSWLGMGNNALNSVLARHAECPDADSADPQPGDPERDDLSGRGAAAAGDQRRPALDRQHPVRGPTHLRRDVGIEPGLRRLRQLPREHRHPQRGHRVGPRLGSDGRPLRSRTIGLRRPAPPACSTR